MAAPTAPCGWDPIPCGCDLPGYDGESGEEPDDATVYAVETAQFVLWALSGRQFGACELTLRPCRRDCQTGLEGAWGARLTDGNWVNLPCRSCNTQCSCVDICEVRLPHAPAGEIMSVIYDGETLEADQYWLEDSEWLVLATSAGCWPDCQDMSAPLGEPGTYGVTYTQGVPVPTAGKRAVGALACEILKACRNDSGCCLPKRTQSITRQGISMMMLDPFEFFEQYKTGIYEVDLFLVAVNPEGRSRGSRVMSPDSEPRMRNTWL